MTRSIRSVPFLLLLTLALVPLAPFAGAHVDHGPGGEYEAQDIDETFTLARNRIAELNFDAEEGQIIAWSVEIAGDTPVYVDVHAHGANGTVEYYQDNATTSASQDFEVPETGAYSILVSRSSDPPAEVTLRARGAFHITSTEGFEITEDSPAPGILLVFVAALGALAIAARSRQ